MMSLENKNNNLVVCVPEDIEKVEKGIKALEYQISIMNDNLKCPVCGSELELEVSFDGCDWDSKEGEGSGFNNQIALSCPKMGCGRVFPIGRVKKESDFSVVIDKYRRFK